ncbi:hypothetical protein AALC17_17840 [Oscillospiraceae bacterium 38-13]
MAKQYKVGIYCRLSVDDASNSAKAKGYIPSDESVSIENQENICQGGFHPKDEIPPTSWKSCYYYMVLI